MTSAMVSASILVVDDDEATRDVLRWVLEDAGYTVTEAADGLAALAVMRASITPLVTLLDLDLPRADGLAVLTAVASEPTLAARHRYILLTAVAPKRVEQTDEICARLAVPVVFKPFDVDDLMRAIALASADAARAVALPASAAQQLRR